MMGERMPTGLTSRSTGPGARVARPRPVSVSVRRIPNTPRWRGGVGRGAVPHGAILAAMNTDLLAEVLKLSPSDRLQLIEALWDTLSEADVPVTPEERTLLDERLADLEQNPDAQSSWAEVKARLEQRRP